MDVIKPTEAAMHLLIFRVCNSMKSACNCDVVVFFLLLLRAANIENHYP